MLTGKRLPHCVIWWMRNDLNWSFLFFNSDDPPTHAAQGNWSWNCWMCLPLQFPAPCWMQHAFVIYLFECRYVRKFPQSPIFHKKGCFTHLLHPLLRLRLPVAPLLCLPAMFGRPQSHSPVFKLTSGSLGGCVQFQFRCLPYSLSGCLIELSLAASPVTAPVIRGPGPG